jgi:hypothetical protein
LGNGRSRLALADFIEATGLAPAMTKGSDQRTRDWLRLALLFIENVATFK